MIKDFSSILINKNASVIEAMKQLDKTAEKILFVVEENNKLVGSLTDGDIRRWILKGGALNSEVKDVCFKETFFILRNYDIDQVREEILKRKINYVPILDENKIITEFLIWDKLFSGKLTKKTKQKLDVPVVIMAGGKGTRLDPFTRVLPKPLIPIGDKTILEIILDKFLVYQVKKFYLSINYKAKIIKSYIEELNPSYDLEYIFEDKPLGTVGSLKKLESKVMGNLILTNCDIIIDIDYSELYEHHTQNKNDITIVASVKHYHIPYGVCEIANGGELVEIKEKPAYEFLINTGMYVLNNNVIKYIPANQFFHITDLIKKVKKSGLKVGVFPISENSWVDTGEWIEYKKALEKIKL